MVAAMDVFTELFGNLLAFVYHCFDRIVIHGYLSALSQFRAGSRQARENLDALVPDLARLSRFPVTNNPTPN